MQNIFHRFAGKRTRRTKGIRSVRESFRQGAARLHEPELKAAHHGHRSTAHLAVAEAAQTDGQQRSSRVGTAAWPIAALPPQQTAQPRAADLHRDRPSEGTARAAALRGRESPSLTAAQQAGASLVAAVPLAASALPSGLRGAAFQDTGEQQAGLVPYSSSEADGSEETLSDAIVISDKIVSAAATNTAAHLGDDVRGFGSDNVRLLTRPLTLLLTLSARFHAAILLAHECCLPHP